MFQRYNFARPLRFCQRRPRAPDKRMQYGVIQLVSSNWCHSTGRFSCPIDNGVTNGPRPPCPSHSVGKSLYITGKAQRTYSLKLTDKLKLAEALVAGGLDRSVRGGALGERSMRGDRSVRAGAAAYAVAAADRSVRGGGASGYASGRGGGGDRSMRGGGAYTSDRSFHGRAAAGANVPQPNQQPTAEAVLFIAAAAAAAAGQGPAEQPAAAAAEYSRAATTELGDCEDARSRSTVRISGGGAAASGAAARTSGGGAGGVRTRSHGAACAHSGSVDRRRSVEVEADAVLALSKALCPGGPAASCLGSPSRNPSRRPPQPQPLPQPPQPPPPQQSCSSSLTAAAADTGAALLIIEGVISDVGISGASGGGGGGGGGFSPQLYRRQNRSMPTPAAGEVSGGAEGGAGRVARRPGLAGLQARKGAARLRGDIENQW
jgi:hypothetical protein